jgi:hypothetical protein
MNTNKAEEILRTYINFEDVNGSEPITLLPLTIIDAMEEYATQCQKDMAKEVKEPKYAVKGDYCAVCGCTEFWNDEEE